VGQSTSEKQGEVTVVARANRLKKELKEQTRTGTAGGRGGREHAVERGPRVKGANGISEEEEGRKDKELLGGG
jgi:hypothetical protein